MKNVLLVMTLSIITLSTQISNASVEMISCERVSFSGKTFGVLIPRSLVIKKKGESEISNIKFSLTAQPNDFDWNSGYIDRKPLVTRQRNLEQPGWKPMGTHTTIGAQMDISCKNVAINSDEEIKFTHSTRFRTDDNQNQFSSFRVETQQSRETTLLGASSVAYGKGHIETAKAVYTKSFSSTVNANLTWSIMTGVRNNYEGDPGLYAYPGYIQEHNLFIAPELTILK